LFRRAFKIDSRRCQNRRGELKIIAAIVPAPVIERILTHPGLAAAMGFATGLPSDGRSQAV
jgi:hypothetical protein